MAKILGPVYSEFVDGQMQLGSVGILHKDTDPTKSPSQSLSVVRNSLKEKLKFQYQMVKSGITFYVM